ncbi:MAG: hypothetical protein K2N01_05380 [Lachnospiraceae bacterium]|nr:hypothetical protein [Lachnospiraceae bacterium]
MTGHTKGEKVMYYFLRGDGLAETDGKGFDRARESLAVFTTAEWRQEMELQDAFRLNMGHDSVHFCKLERHDNYLFGTFQIPRHGQEGEHNFAVYLLAGKLIFVDDEGLAEHVIGKLRNQKMKKGYGLGRFLFDFLMYIIEGDILYLAQLEHEITEIEEKVLRDKMDGFHVKMLRVKKEISGLYRYYTQLQDVGETLGDNSLELFDKDELQLYEIFTDRVERLQSETQVLREYAMQVQDVYQSEISIRQNAIMKVLTVVTTIFLPLTLIAGWYGMNFKYMPELAWEYGYPAAIGLSVIVVLVCLWIFRKKKYI